MGKKWIKIFFPFVGQCKFPVELLKIREEQDLFYNIFSTDVGTCLRHVWVAVEYDINRGLGVVGLTCRRRVPTFVDENLTTAFLHWSTITDFSGRTKRLHSYGWSLLYQLCSCVMAPYYVVLRADMCYHSIILSHYHTSSNKPTLSHIHTCNQVMTQMRELYCLW